MKIDIGRLAKRFGQLAGQSLVEYSLVLGLVVVVCIAALTLLGNNSNTKVNTIATQLQ